jgi:ClpX C4-type zinc finger
MALRGEAKKLYQRDYMRRRRAGVLPVQRPLPPASVSPKPEPKRSPGRWRCSFCDEPASKQRILIAGERHASICESCVAEAATLIAAQRVS